MTLRPEPRKVELVRPAIPGVEWMARVYGCGLRLRYEAIVAGRFVSATTYPGLLRRMRKADR